MAKEIKYGADARASLKAGVDTLDSAKKLTMSVPKEMKAVMEALGLSGDRQPVEAEITYVRRWTQRYGYGMDIIAEACKRTVISTGKASFKYANGILKGWHDAKVKKLEDIIAADEEFRRKKATGQAGDAAPKKESATKGSSGKFHNFAERKYDYESLMKDILSE